MSTGLHAEEPGLAEAYADTVRIRVLPESMLQEQQEQRPGNDPPARGFDPYSTDVGALTAPPKRRRTLDDMRRLSEAIVRNRLASK